MRYFVSENSSLLTILKGSTIILFGTFFSLLIQFINKIILVRNISQYEYGVYSLGFAIYSMLLIVSMLGLQEGTTRYISYYNGKNNVNEAKAVINSALKLVTISSCLTGVFLFYFASHIASKFDEPALTTTLEIFAIALPFLVIIRIWESIFRGFGDTSIKVYFNDIALHLIFSLGLISLVYISVSYIHVLYVYLISVITVCLFVLVYSFKKNKIPIKLTFKVNKASTKLLLLFSVPLLATAVIKMIITWTDTLMLGYFMSSKMVALYNVAVPLANIIQTFMTAMIFMYVPVASDLHSRNLQDELKLNYKILSKWIFLITFPFLTVILFYPEFILDLFFGFEYTKASIVLIALSMGFFIDVLVGPNLATLIVIGKTKVVMASNLIGAMLNVILNFSLIPIIGIKGAAISSVFSLLVINVLNSLYLYHISEIHPLTKDYIMSIAIVVLTSLSVKYLLHGITNMYLKVIMYLIFFGILSTIMILLTNSINEEDMKILAHIKQKIRGKA